MWRPPKITATCPGIDYDDGFIAFLNGIEIARSSNTGVAGVAGDFATSYIEAVLYSGGQPEQWLECRRIRALASRGHQRVFGSSAQLQCRVIGFEHSPVLGLTRKDGALENWSQPQRGGRNLKAHIHAFQLSTGESVVLGNADGDVVDALPISPRPEAGYSVGRLEGETEDWCIFDAPTRVKRTKERCATQESPRTESNRSFGLVRR